MTHLTEIELVMALDGELEPRQAELAMRHMELCAECRNEFEKLRGVSERVQAYHGSLYAHPVAKDPEFSQEKVSSFGFRVSGWKWAFAAAAVVLVGVAVGFWGLSHSSNSHPIAQKQTTRDKDGAQANARSFVAKDAPQDDNSCELGGSGSNADCASLNASRKSGGPTNARSFVAKNAPQDDSSCELGGSGSNADCARLNATRKSDVAIAEHTKGNSKPKAAAAHDPEKQLAQFTELPFSDTSLPLDEATVVRVELPAAALRQAGVPVEEDNASAMLQADVILGLDGLPRGIRLVKNRVAGIGTN